MNAHPKKLDQTVTLAELKTFIKNFVETRDWQKGHNPKNLSMSIAIEAAELMEKFQFVNNEESMKIANINKQEVAHEFIDILVYMLNFANACDIDIATYFYEKMAINAQRFPIKKVVTTSSINY